MEEQVPDRGAEFYRRLEALQDELQVKINMILDFPMYKELPIEVQLAMEVIKNHGGTFRINVIDNS